MTTDVNERPELDGRRIRGQRTRERLLTAAVELFSSRGFEATTMKDLAEASGIQAPAIYNHFESKELILVAATTWALEDFLDRVVGRDDPSASAERRLEQLVRRHVLYQIENERVASANDLVLAMDSFEEVVPAPALAHLKGLMRQYLDLTTRLVRELIDSADDVPSPRVTALVILSTCDRVLSWYKRGGAMSGEQVADAYWTLIRSMLRLSPPDAGSASASAAA
jgi:AcrR family transcriptional regulator